LLPVGEAPRPALNSVFVTAAAKIADGDLDGGLAHLVDTVDGPGTWRTRSETDKQEWRDNAATLLGQINEQRGPFTRADAEAIRIPTLLIDGANSPAGRNVPVLTSAITNARRVTIAKATHMMFRQRPVEFAEAVVAFAGGLDR
jgi:esterase